MEADFAKQYSRFGEVPDNVADTGGVVLELKDSSYGSLIGKTDMLLFGGLVQKEQSFDYFMTDAANVFVQLYYVSGQQLILRSRGMLSIDPTMDIDAAVTTNWVPLDQGMPPAMACVATILNFVSKLEKHVAAIVALCLNIEGMVEDSVGQQNAIDEILHARLNGVISQFEVMVPKLRPDTFAVILIEIWDLALKFLQQLVSLEHRNSEKKLSVYLLQMFQQGGDEKFTQTLSTTEQYK
ncbi:hypothetical protein V1512DRAFT_252918 [Lipomyces arxii]|uniref:uncharacterized protein n=1 Tax=Lipomyces arxii TaxID=56418 RepID=UPI0034CDA603